MSKSIFKKYLDIGPGGKRCPCCFPLKRADRKRLYRAAKRADKLDSLKQQGN